MQYPYHFVNVSDEQAARRRQLLDSYGQFAQISILLLPLLYQLFHGIKLLSTMLQRHGKYESVKQHQSPVVSKFGDDVGSAGGNRWAKFKWALGEEVVEGWGTRQEWLIAGTWAAWLGVLAMRDTGDDYLHITRRFGIIAASQFPLHFALALKFWSPIHHLARRSHEELNIYHRLLGRIIYAFLFLHATFYLNFYVQKGLLTKRIRDWDVILGLSAITTASLLLTGALQRVRTWNYRVFFYSHVALSISLLPILYFHVSHLRIYILETIFIYALLVIQRNYSQSVADAEIAFISGTELLSIKVPLKGHSSARRKYVPGQHIYIGFPTLAQKLRINPFSIANPSPTKDNHVQLIARALSGTTAQLASLAITPQPTKLTIEGPYGSAAYFPCISDYERVLFVAGGVGATFTLPLYLDLLKQKADGRSVPSVRFVWTVRDMKEGQWGIDALRRECEGIEDGVELYVTGSSKAGEDGQFELLEVESLNKVDANDRDPAEKLITTNAGRPDLKVIVNEVFRYETQGRTAILVCGPKGIAKDLRREVGRWVGKGREVFWHNEEFGW